MRHLISVAAYTGCHQLFYLQPRALLWAIPVLALRAKEEPLDDPEKVVELGLTPSMIAAILSKAA